MTLRRILARHDAVGKLTRHVTDRLSERMGAETPSWASVELGEHEALRDARTLHARLRRRHLASSQDDFPAYGKMTANLGSKCQVVGDDLLVTNPKRVQKAIDELWKLEGKSPPARRSAKAASGAGGGVGAPKSSSAAKKKKRAKKK